MSVGNISTVYFDKKPGKSLNLMKWLKENPHAEIDKLVWPKLTNTENSRTDDYRTIQSILLALEFTGVRKENAESLIEFFKTHPHIRSYKIWQLCNWIAITQFITFKLVVIIITSLTTFLLNDYFFYYELWKHLSFTHLSI